MRDEPDPTSPGGGAAPPAVLREVSPSNTESQGDRRTDAVLVSQARLGDREAFTEIVNRYGPRMYRYALRMLDGGHEGAEDAVQEALTDAWLHLPDFRGDSALPTWLFRLAANRVLAARRRRRPTPVDNHLLDVQADDDAQQPESKVQHAQVWETLDLALTELPWRQRASWILRELEGMSYDDIATILQTTPTVVRGQLHRARRTLAVRMEQWR